MKAKTPTNFYQTLRAKSANKGINYYYSPFPRQKSNNEVLRKSYAKKIGNSNQTLVDIPPTVTMSYMKKNPYYFDLQKSIDTCRNVKAKKTSVNKKGIKRPKTATNNLLYKSQTLRAKKPITPAYTVFDSKKLNNILNGIADSEDLLEVRPYLEPGCEIVKTKEKGFTIPEEERQKLTNKEILEIINKIQIPMEHAKDFGKVPN